jgi:hypothetical protein
MQIFKFFYVFPIYKTNLRNINFISLVFSNKHIIYYLTPIKKNSLYYIFKRKKQIYIVKKT